MWLNRGSLGWLLGWLKKAVLVKRGTFGWFYCGLKGAVFGGY